MMTSTDTLYKTLQAVLIRPEASRGEIITLHGEGTLRPYNYRHTLCQVLDCSRFISTLFRVNDTSKRYGIFVLSAFQSERSTNTNRGADPTIVADSSLNKIAYAALGLTLYGNIVIASAERCGANQYLYDLGPICPDDVGNFIRTGQVPAFLAPLSGSSPGSKLGLVRLGRTKGPRPLDIGVSISINEAYREWWELFSEAKQIMIKELSDEMRTKLGSHLKEFLSGMVSVWCGLCGSKYRKLALCRGCQCVAYCSQGCWKTGFTQHQEICHILAGRGEQSPHTCV